MPDLVYDITIKDYASGALAKLQRSALKTEGAVSKLMRQTRDGGKQAVPSIDTLRFKLDKIRERRDAAFGTKRIRLFNEHIRKTERQLKKLENLPPLSVAERFKKVAGSAINAYRPLDSVGAVGIAIQRSFGAMVSIGSGFNKEMSNVAALTGATGSSLKNLSAVARGLGATTAFSARQAAEGMGFLAQAGFNTEQITAALPETLNLAAAGSVELGEAADISSDVLSGFGLEAAQTGRVVDVMAKTTTTSNTNIREMGEAMKFFAPTAKTLGISLEESSAAVGLLGNAGIKGSLATQSLGSAFTRLAKGGGEVAKTSKKLGLELFQDGKFVGIAGAVTQLEGAFAGMTREQKAGHIATLFGQEAFKNISILVDAGADKIRGYTDELRNSRGVAREIADTKMDNLAGDWAALKSAVGEVAISVYNFFRPALRGAVQIIKGAVTTLMNMGGWFQRNGRWIGALSAGVGTYIAVVQVANRWTKIVTATQKTWAAITTFSTAKQKGLTGATKLATIAQRIYNNVLRANPYAMVIGGVLALGAAVWAYAGSVNRLSAAQQAQLDVAQKVKESTIEERTEAETLLSIFKDHQSTDEQKTAAYEKLNVLYPGILGKYKDEKEALENIDTAQNDIIDSIERRAKAEASYDLLKEAQRDLVKLKEEGASTWDKIKGGAASVLGGPAVGASVTQHSFLNKLNKAAERVKRLSQINKDAQKDLLTDPAKAQQTITGTLENNHTTETVRNTTESTVTGGKRQQVFNIHINKVLEMGDQIVHEGREQADEITSMVLEGITRSVSGTIRTAAS